ncbi:MAG TPA: hypothetical protein VGT41_03635 [Candidatus Babeliales bacterium]|nr:hypothetical protein [Candidatus Babeliales bacterium]
MTDNRENILVCKRVGFVDQKGEDAFFEWIKKIEFIDNFYGRGDELYLETLSYDDISDDELDDLIGLFYRYKIANMNQLARFLNDRNKHWFYDNKKAFWHKKVFGE